uniref:Uncharacterized protein n=1 Tax=Arundo donax TaxID=35708 RepID=A0A0A9GUX9_ARUDO
MLLPQLSHSLHLLLKEMTTQLFLTRIYTPRSILCNGLNHKLKAPIVDDTGWQASFLQKLGPNLGQLRVLFLFLLRQLNIGLNKTRGMPFPNNLLRRLPEHIQCGLYHPRLLPLGTSSSESMNRSLG